MTRALFTANPLFDRFWIPYPRHVAKQDAVKAWTQLRPGVELVDVMLAALAWQCRQPGWIKDGGIYVPYPATWLRGRRWEDEPFDPITAPTEADERRLLARLTPFEQAKRAGLK